MLEKRSHRLLYDLFTHLHLPCTHSSSPQFPGYDLSEVRSWFKATLRWQFKGEERWTLKNNSKHKNVLLPPSPGSAFLFSPSSLSARMYVIDVTIEFTRASFLPCKSKDGVGRFHEASAHHNPMGTSRSFGFIILKFMIKQKFYKERKSKEGEKWNLVKKLLKSCLLFIIIVLHYKIV